MKTLILNTTEKNTFNGKQFGFVLEEKNEDGLNREYYPFFQNLVSDENVGKYLNVTEENGSKSEFITES